MRVIVRGFVLLVLLLCTVLPAAHAASTIVRDLPPGLTVPDAANPAPRSTPTARPRRISPC